MRLVRRPGGALAAVALLVTMVGCAGESPAAPIDAAAALSERVFVGDVAGTDIFVGFAPDRGEECGVGGV